MAHTPEGFSLINEYVRCDQSRLIIISLSRFSKVHLTKLVTSLVAQAGHALYYDLKQVYACGSAFCRCGKINIHRLKMQTSA